MKAILVLLILGLLASGSVFAESCVSKADCDNESYCGVDNRCHPYMAGIGIIGKSCVSNANCGEDAYCGADNECHLYPPKSSTNVSCCCGPSLIILTVTGLVLANRK